MPKTVQTPRYQWASPGEWLLDKINGMEAGTQFAELRQIATALVRLTDSDTLQDEFQDEMAEAGYFRDLDLKVPVLYEMEPIGVGGTLEANGNVEWFCSVKCRSRHNVEADETVQEGLSSDFETGTVCDECGKVVGSNGNQ